MDNPYQGREPYGQAWDLGYQFGQQNISDTDPSVPDFSDWNLDADTAASAQQAWREGALAGRDDAAGGGDTSDLPRYDSDTDTLYAAAEEFPALVQLAQAGDVDTWLTALGVDISIFADDPPSV